MALTSFELGRLRLIGHVREELDRAGVEAESIQCRSGGVETAPGMARLRILLNGTVSSLDLTVNEIEDCRLLVAGEIWYKISAFIDGAIKDKPSRSSP